MLLCQASCCIIRLRWDFLDCGTSCIHIAKPYHTLCGDDDGVLVIIIIITMGSVERALRVSISHLTARARGELINYQCCHQCHCHHHHGRHHPDYNVFLCSSEAYCFWRNSTVMRIRILWIFLLISSTFKDHRYRPGHRTSNITLWVNFLMLVAIGKNISSTKSDYLMGGWCSWDGIAPGTPWTGSRAEL